MCFKPLPVLEQGAKRQGNLPVLIPFGAGRKQARIAQNVAPVLKKFRFAVERRVWRQFTSNRRHGSHLFSLSHRVMPVIESICIPIFRSPWSILLTFKTLMTLSHVKPFRDPQDFSTI
jgi:hypothetical protein